MSGIEPDVWALGAFKIAQKVRSQSLIRQTFILFAGVKTMAGRSV